MYNKAKNTTNIASEKAAFFMRSFRDKAQAAAGQGGQMTSKLIGQMKSKAETVNNTIYKQGVRISQYGSSAPSNSSSSNKPPPRLSKGHVGLNVPSFVSVGAAAYVAEDEKVKSLCALGFSPAVVRHALRRCDGDVEKTGLWLLDEAHRDERLAAELEGGDLVDGALARINGLRGAIQLNGMPVVLQFYDEETQRWIVQMPDGTAKSIRPRNLDRLDDEAAAVAASEMESALKVTGSQEAPVKAVMPTESEPNRLEEQLANVMEEVELRKQVREMIGILTGTEEDEALKALSVQELLEVMRSLPEQARAEAEQIHANSVNSAACGPADPKELALEREKLKVALEKSESGSTVSPSLASTQVAVEEEANLTSMSSTKSLARPESPKRKASEAAASELLELERKLKESAEKMHLWEAQQMQQQQALEAREAELLESQERWRSEAEAKAEQIQFLESREEAQQQAVAQVESREESHQQEAFAEEAAAQKEVAEEAQAQLEEQLAELRILQAKAESAAEDLEKRQVAQRHCAEERELRLLEQEADQMRVGKALQEEQERLEQQRRAVLLLQQSLALPGISEAPCSEMHIDDSACLRVEEAAPEGSDLSAGTEKFGQDTVVFRPPRRSIEGKGKFESKASTDTGEETVMMSHISSEEFAGESDDDEEEEVWDLDWSMVSTKLRRASSVNEVSDNSPARRSSRGGSEQSPQSVPGPIPESPEELVEERPVPNSEAVIVEGKEPSGLDTPVDPVALAMKEKLAARQKLCTDATEDVPPTS